MYRLKDGRQGVIQALGNSFGVADQPPYIKLDKDDRSGASANGENMDFFRPELIDFAVVFAFIYEGVPNWRSTNARVVLSQQGAPDIEVQIDNPNSNERFCVLASLTGRDGGLEVRREDLFFNSHRLWTPITTSASAGWRATNNTGEEPKSCWICSGDRRSPFKPSAGPGPWRWSCGIRGPWRSTCPALAWTAQGRLSDERYFLFYNQRRSPEGAMALSEGASGGTARFQVDLAALPDHIQRLSFTAAIDGGRTLRELEQGSIGLWVRGEEMARYAYAGNEFSGERAIVAGELYRKNGDWKFSAVGRGFNGGLRALVESFGGVVSDPVPPPPPPVRTAVSARTTRQPAAPAGGPPPSVGDILRSLPPHVCTRMEGLARRCQGDLDFLAPLYKASFAALAQVPRAAERDLQTVLCADASGSMFDLYRGGRVQQMFDKFFALSSTLSDSGALDCWAFAAKSRQLEPVTLDNIRDYTFSQAGGYERWMSMLNYQYNNEPEAMRDIMMIYGGLRRPILVLFLTDGRLQSDWEIEEILIKTSRFPVFWQFIGLYGEEYGVLNHLDEIDGRHTQNAAFLKMEDFDDFMDSGFYRTIFANTAAWLEELDRKQMLP